MKHLPVRLLAVLLCLLLMPVMAHAEISVDWDSEVVRDGSLQPGRSYLFPLMNGSYQVEQGENTGYAYRVRVEPKQSGITASIVTENRLQWVKVSVSSTAGRNEPYAEVIVTVTDRQDRYYTYEDAWTFDIGYGDTYYVSGDTVDLYNDQTAIEFDDRVTTCYIYLPDGSEFIANLLPNTSRNRTDGVNRVIDFYSSSDMIYDVETRYGMLGALEYMRFFTGATFNQSLLRFYAPSNHYVYAIDGSNRLTRIPATRNGDFLVISTTTLGSYVLSDVDLGVDYGSATGGNNQVISSAPNLPEAPRPTTSSGYPPATGGTYKPNPGTGAAA